MTKQKYRFNSETLSFELHRMSSRKRIKRGFYIFASSIILSVVCFSVYSRYFDTPKVLSLRRANAEMSLNLELLKKRIVSADKYLTQLQQRDNNIYRPAFGLDMIPSSIRDAGFGGIDRYAHLEKSSYSGILTDCSILLDKLLRKVCIQSMSFDTVAQNAMLTRQMVDCVPAIQPLAQSSPRITSFFGVRNDPMSGKLQNHDGIDLAGPIGEVVFATGNGKVIIADHSLSKVGYGNVVLIDHGFGYTTRYAHLHTITVKKGEIVKRGQQIGTLGDTGKSTGPHLHYEVRLRNNPLNPLNFFVNDIEPDDFASIVYVANTANIMTEYD